MDMIRSSYTVGMRFSRTSGIVPVRWFFAARGAKYIGVPNAFFSTNWEDASTKFVFYGEQPGPRHWSNGQRPALAVGQRICEPSEDFTVGIAEGVTLGRSIAAGPVPSCCLDPLGAGGPGFGFVWEGAVSWGASGGAVGTGVSSWVRIPPVAPMYLKTILLVITPGVTRVGTFLTQPWTRRISVTCVGPGGGGGGCTGGVSSSSAGGGGSSGGTFNQVFLGTLMSTVFNFQIGGRGAGGPAGNNNGSDGTADTVFTGPSIVTAAKGKGGRGAAASLWITGGSAVAGGAAPLGGNPGFPGLALSAGSGTNPIGGHGACSSLGGAGTGQVNPGAGTDATPNTGSGGAGSAAFTVSLAGGKGADGVIVIEEWSF